MSANRLEQLMINKNPQYFVGSPVLLEACALYRDKENNTCVAQMKWKNIDSRPIKALMIELDGKDVFNQTLKPVQYQYDVILVEQGKEFGEKTPVLLRENKMIKFNVILQAVSFLDDTVWRPESDGRFLPLPENKPQELTGELLGQLRRDLGKQGRGNTASFMPQMSSGLWQCGCGSWQREDTPCLKCKITQSKLADISATSVLVQHLNKYKEEQEKKAEEVRNGLYSNAVNSMLIANQDSQKWTEVIEKLEDPRIAGYRNVPELLLRAKKEYEEASAEEEKIKIQKEEEEKRKTEEAEKKKKKILLLSISSVVIIIAALLLITQVFIPESNYRKAENLRANGNYAEAIEVFQNLGGYSDAAQQILATYYTEGEAKRQEQDWDGAILAFTNAVAFSEAAEQISETKYLQAKSLIALEKYNDALTILNEIRGYKDVDNIIKTDENIAAAAAAREAKIASYKTVGSYVTFGTYPHTSSGTDSTAIEWLVLDYDTTNNRSLLISRYALDAQPYNSTYTSITWEQCTLRTWLNSTFMNKAFNATEQGAILTTAVDNSSIQGYSKWNTSGGNNTQDKVFLLSYAEANKYLSVTYDDSKNMKSRVAPTAYAIKQGAYISSSNKTVEDTATGWWWLRSPGYYQRYAAYVNTDGSLSNNDVDNTRGCVRPASPCLPVVCPCERQPVPWEEKEYRSLSQGIPPQALRSPRKNMPTETRTADETDRFSYICLWDARLGFMPLAARPPSGFQVRGNEAL